MKKYMVLAVALCAQVFAGSEDLDDVYVLASKVDTEVLGSFFCLSDGSFWRVYDFQPRWRSIKEWWNDVSLVPHECKSHAKDWFLGSEIQVISRKEAQKIDLNDADNEKILKNCTHLLYNLAAQKYLFAVHLDPKDCLVQVYEESFSLGHKKGYTAGRLENSSESSKEFKKGYEAGYFKGLQDAKKNK